VKTGYVVSGLSLLITGAASAHHGIANFNLNEDIEVRGTVTRVDFINPHSWLYLDVTTDDGSVEKWRCEMRGATVLRRSGWSTEMFPEGMPIRITGSPDRRDPQTCYLSTAYFPDGSSVDRYGQRTEPAPAVVENQPLRLANGHVNLTGDWAAEQRIMADPRGQRGTLVPISIADQVDPDSIQGFPGARGTALSFEEDPVDTFWNTGPSALPLTPEGTAAIEGLDFSTGDNPRLRCAPTNILFDWTFEMDVNHITHTEDTIRMRYGSMGIERTIHLGMDAHPADIEPSVAGHSIGRWEDDVLVVDTVGFLPGILSADGRLPHSAALHVVERFSLDPETMTLTRTYTAEDPAYFEGEYSGRDAVLPSDLPYSGTTECEDRTYDSPAAPE
jgi:hypothetical protein